jgi:hypothetical protein
MMATGRRKKEVTMQCNLRDACHLERASLVEEDRHADAVGGSFYFFLLFRFMLLAISDCTVDEDIFLCQGTSFTLLLYPNTVVIPDFSIFCISIAF